MKWAQTLKSQKMLLQTCFYAKEGFLFVSIFYWAGLSVSISLLRYALFPFNHLTFQGKKVSLSLSASRFCWEIENVQKNIETHPVWLGKLFWKTESRPTGIGVGVNVLVTVIFTLNRSELGLLDLKALWSKKGGEITGRKRRLERDRVRMWMERNEKRGSQRSRCAPYLLVSY